MNRKWMLIPFVLASICQAQTFRRNYEFPDVGGAIGSLPVGSIPGSSLTVSMMANGDWGDFTMSSNVASLDTGVVADNEIDYANVTLSDFDYETAWRVWYSNTDGDVTELALGADNTFLQSNGVSAAPTFETVSSAPISSGTGPGLGGGKGRIKFTDDTIDVVAIRTATLRIQYQEDDTAIVNAMNLGILDFYGDDDTASADEVAAQIQATSTGTWTDGAEDARLELSVANNGTLNNDQLVLATDGTVTTSAAFLPTDLVIPQASPAVPAVDGGVEIDFTDGTLVVQHGSAHAELGASTDVVVGKLIKSFGGTLFEPDNINDVMTVFPVNSIEYPHGIVITAIYLGISSNTTYTLTVQNFDDFDTINASNGTIDTVTYTADTTGEVIDSTPTYATIAAGQLVMISIPSTDVDWISFRIYFYEPAA
jgi:hypothetical protein